MTATDLHRSWCGCRDTTTPCTRDSLVSKDTKVYQLALLCTTVSEALLCVFTHVPSSRLAGSAAYQGCAALGLKGHCPQRLCRMELWFVVVIWFSSIRRGRGVVVKLVISLTLKGEINNITLNNTLWFHYTMVYRLATVDSEISGTSSAKQQSCQSVSVWV